MDQRHAKRVAELNEHYQAELAATNMRWNAIEAQVSSFKQYLIEIIPGGRYAPKERVFAAFEVPYRDCESLPDEYREKCTTGIAAHYGDALRARYYKADFEWAWIQFNAAPSSADLEALLAFSHNTSILNVIRERQAEIRRLRSQTVERLKSVWHEQVAQSETIRDEEIAAAEAERKRVWRAVGAGLQAAGESIQSQSARNHAVVSEVSESNGGCTDDWACGAGFMCLKNNFESTGRCVRAVNEHGGPAIGTPRPNSWGVKLPTSTDCHFVNDCPPMFRCDQASGACIR